jgi:sulfatase modifying factor 1
MRFIHHSATVTALLCLLACPVQAQNTQQWHFEFADGVPYKLVWPTALERSYDLWCSADLVSWDRAYGFPKSGNGAPMEYSFAPSSRGFFKITSAVAATPDGFVVIPGGIFLMGNQSDTGIGGADELPVHEVYVSSFLMGAYEVTYELWEEIRAWGLNNGYTDLLEGNNGEKLKGLYHPVHSMRWFDIVKWCNARSEKDGLTPCYSVTGAIFRTGSGVPDCNWNASGYRLPTEAEWEKAARGGLIGKRFPWGDTISHHLANYYSSSIYAFDVSLTRGYHPNFSFGFSPYTSPVGSFAPNGYGLYDMAGNQWEWCWDSFGGIYPSTLQIDPRGPDIIRRDDDRVARGGYWGEYAAACRVAERGEQFTYSLGQRKLSFRLAKKANP